jgi:parvulin-like peptidyl-prolyl isomerase
MVGKGDKDAARVKAEAIRARIATAADFGKVAREASDDPTAAINGGELGWFEARQMDPAFAAAAFAMKNNGEISAPVLSSFGYHLILLEDRRPAGFRSFDEVKPEIMGELKAKALADAKAESTRRIFTDPTLKVDAELINLINTDAVAKASAAKAAAPARP